MDSRGHCCFIPECPAATVSSLHKCGWIAKISSLKFHTAIVKSSILGWDSVKGPLKSTEEEEKESTAAATEISFDGTGAEVRSERAQPAKEMISPSLSKHCS